MQCCNASHVTKPSSTGMTATLQNAALLNNPGFGIIWNLDCHVLTLPFNVEPEAELEVDRRPAMPDTLVTLLHPESGWYKNHQSTGMHRKHLKQNPNANTNRNTADNLSTSLNSTIHKTLMILDASCKCGLMQFPSKLICSKTLQTSPNHLC